MTRRRAAAEQALLEAHVTAALAEDRADDDITSAVVLPRRQLATATIVAGAPGVLAGTAPAAMAFRLRPGRARVRLLLRDGARVRGGASVLTVRGRVFDILSAERTALNYLMRLSGIASLTARYLRALRGTRVRLLDTRKTTPLLRFLEKAAVRAGGGRNHRMGLHDAVLIKENHVLASGGIAPAVARARERLERLGRGGILVEVEAQSLADVRAAAEAPVDRLMLDNFTPAGVRRALVLIGRRRAKRKLEIEVSGGIDLSNLRRFALPGVDYISVGALTHSAPALPFSLSWSP